MISPALEPAHITVNEEDGEISLLVARAQGILGRIMVGYRTTPFTASSPEDYEVGFTDDVLMNKQIGEGKICFGCSLFHMLLAGLRGHVGLSSRGKVKVHKCHHHR